MSELTLEAFRQNWEQARHAEKVRMTFTNFYFLIVAAIIAFLSSVNQGINLVSMWYVFFIPIAMSALGFIVS
jgi:hypothetical protein